MFLKNIYDKLEKEQIQYTWLTYISELESIDVSDKKWKLLFILKVLKIWKALWFKYFVKWKELTIEEFKKIFWWVKSYHWNKTIVAWKLKQIIESFALEFTDDYNYDLVTWILTNTVYIEDFLKNKKMKELKVWEPEKWKKIYNTNYIFKWESWKIYSGKWIMQLRSYKEEEVMDILKWYNWDNEKVKLVKDYIINNKDEISKVFKPFRSAVLWVLAELINAEWESKLTKYVLSKLSKETKETKENLDNK